MDYFVDIVLIHLNKRKLLYLYIFFQKFKKNPVPRHVLEPPI
jgi:hypothetical protein